MYIPEKSKKIMEVKMQSARANALFVCGILLAVIALALMIFGISARRELEGAGIGFVIVAALVLAEMGMSSIVNGVTIKAVKFIVYDEGIYGVAAKMNPLSGLLNKTVPFDVLFNEIIGMRYEKELLIQTKNNDYSFVFTKDESYQIMELLKSKCN